jgi:hypothetical protein
VPLPPSELEALLADLLPDLRLRLFDADTLRPFQLGRTTLLSTEPNRPANQDSLSSGEVQIISLALDIVTIAAIWELQGRPARIILIDEPDAHLHPDLQQLLAKFITRIVDRFGVQFVIATHSTTLLSSLGHYGSGGTSVVYLNRSDDTFVAEPFTRHMEELATCLGGHVLMGTLFGARLLLVEGQDDFLVWSHASRGRSIRLAVIPCDGDTIYQYQKTLQQIFVSLTSESSEPLAFVLLDGDKRPPDRADSRARFHQLRCHEIENLYITDEMLCRFSLDWIQACDKIRGNADVYPDKANALKRVADASAEGRRMADIKSVISELALILDPQQETWTVRLGKHLGAFPPTGQLRDFLGEPLVQALWPIPPQ